MGLSVEHGSALLLRPGGGRCPLTSDRARPDHPLTDVVCESAEGCAHLAGGDGAVQPVHGALAQVCHAPGGRPGPAALPVDLRPPAARGPVRGDQQVWAALKVELHAAEGDDVGQGGAGLGRRALQSSAVP